MIVIICCNNIGLASLILLGWKLPTSYNYITELRTSHPDLVFLLFMPSLYSAFLLLATCLLSFLKLCNLVQVSSNAVQAVKKDYVVSSLAEARLFYSAQMVKGTYGSSAYCRNFKTHLPIASQSQAFSGTWTNA